MNLFEMKKDRAAALDKAEGILAKAEAAKRDMSGEEKFIFDAHMAEVNSLTAKIAPIEAQNTIVGKLNSRGFFDYAASHPEQPGPKGTSLREAMKHASAQDVEQLKSFTRYLGGDMTALADLTPSGDGGVFIPTFIAGVVARNYAAFAPVRSYATVWPTVGGNPVTFPVISDSEDAVILAPAALTGLDDVVSGDAPPTEITGPIMGAHKFSSKPVFVPREIANDASLNVLEEMLSALLARIVRTQNKKYTAGTGTGEPFGFMHDAVAHAAGAVALDLDVALDVAYACPVLYRPQGIYMVSDTTAKYLRKLKTGLASDKRQLWADADATKGTPATLHGYPVIINNDMDSVSADGTFAGKSPLAFGDFKRFVVREAEQGAPYIYRWPVPAKDGSAVIAFQRSDSKLVVPEAITKLTVA